MSLVSQGLKHVHEQDPFPRRLPEHVVLGALCFRRVHAPCVVAPAPFSARPVIWLVRRCCVTCCAGLGHRCGCHRCVGREPHRCVRGTCPPVRSPPCRSRVWVRFHASFQSQRWLFVSFAVTRSACTCRHRRISQLMLLYLCSCPHSPRFMSTGFVFRPPRAHSSGLAFPAQGLLHGGTIRTAVAAGSLLIVVSALGFFGAILVEHKFGRFLLILYNILIFALIALTLAGAGLVIVFANKVVRGCVGAAWPSLRRSAVACRNLCSCSPCLCECRRTRASPTTRTRKCGRQ